MFKKVKILIGLSVGEYYWQKAVKSISADNVDSAWKYMSKCYRSTDQRAANYLLLEAYILLRKRRFNDSLGIAEKAISKLDKSAAVVDDERKYLKLYAVDIINLSIVHGEIDKQLFQRDTDFNENHVAARLKIYFPLLKTNAVP